MPMVRHDRVRKYSHVESRPSRHQKLFEGEIVAWIVEQPGSFCPSIQHVIDVAAGRNSFSTWHGGDGLRNSHAIYEIRKKEVRPQFLKRGSDTNYLPSSSASIRRAFSLIGSTSGSSSSVTTTTP